MGLREAAERFGVSVDTLRRRIKDDALPEAFKAEGKFGTTWVVPIAAMGEIAERERWVLKLDVEPDAASELVDSAPAGAQSELAVPNAAVPSVAMPNAAVPTGEPAQGASGAAQGSTALAHGVPDAVRTPTPMGDNPMPSGMLSGQSTAPETGNSPLITEENLEWVERLLAAETRATGAETRLESMEADAQASERRIAQLTRDLEHERAELRRLRTDLASEEKAKAVAVARTDELRGQLKSDRQDLEARIGVAKAEAQNQSERADELQARLGDAQAAMGWWSKRRLNKISPATPVQK